MSEILNIGIVGAGTMGRGIAQVSAQSGFTTQLVDISAAALEKSVAAIEKGFSRLIAKGRLSED